jgi:hypothetical protein
MRLSTALVFLSLALILSAAPVRLVHFVSGVPVGVVEVQVKRGRLTYVARHVFRDESRRFEISWAVDAQGRDAEGLMSEVMALSSAADAGCRDVREERTGKRERLCVGTHGEGTLDDVKLRAAWDARGRLRSVDLLDPEGSVVSRFEQSTLEPVSGKDPFGDGFPLTGVGPRVEMVPQARVRVVEVEGVALVSPATGSCLAEARSWVRAHPSDAVQLGVVIEGDRAWPHAWVRLQTGRFVDPAVEATSAVLAARRYVAFQDAEAGTLYLELASGRRRLRRSSQ